MNTDEIKKLARRDGVQVDTIKRRIRKYGEQGAREFKPMSRSARSRLGGKASGWDHFKLPGSPSR